MRKPPKSPLDPNPDARVTVTVERVGVSCHDLATAVFERHTDEQNRLSAEMQDDEQRWQGYLASGRSIPLSTVRSRLQQLVAEAERSVPHDSKDG